MARIRIANRLGAEGRPLELESSPAVSLLNAFLAAGIGIRHDCGGKALCGTCVLRPLSGGAGLSPTGRREAERLAAGGQPVGCRLACQTHAMRDAEVEIVLE
jgi:ferredoxin